MPTLIHEAAAPLVFPHDGHLVQQWSYNPDSPIGSSTDLHSFKRKVFSKMLGRLFIKNQDSLGYVEASRQSNLLEWPEARGYCKIESMTGQTLVDLDRVSTLYHKPAKANLIRPDVSYSMPQDIRATQASLQQMAAEYSPTVRRHCR